MSFGAGTSNTPQAMFYQEFEPGSAPEGSFWVRKSDKRLYTYDAAIGAWVPIPSLPPSGSGFTGTFPLERVEWEDPDLVKYVKTVLLANGLITSISPEVRSVIVSTEDCDAPLTTTTTSTTPTTTTTTTTEATTTTTSSTTSTSTTSTSTSTTTTTTPTTTTTTTTSPSFDCSAPNGYRIVGYSETFLDVPSCGDAAGAEPVWDGTFPTKIGDCGWFPDSDKNVRGKFMQDGQTFIDGDTGLLEIEGEPFGAVFWSGTNSIGDPYTFTRNSGCSAGPATITIEPIP